MSSVAAPPVLSAPEPSRHTSPTVKAQALTHLIVGQAQSGPLERFLSDFGLDVAHRAPGALYLRSLAPTPYCYRIEQRDRPGFRGFGLQVSSLADLEALARLPGASPVQPVPHPGGGRAVVLTDPSGFLVEAIHGQAIGDESPHRAALPLNFGGARLRVNETQRPAGEPPEILRLGHLALEVADFQATCGWYTRHFGFLPSDVQVLPDGSPAVVFLRLNLGSTPADHHTLALAQGLMPKLSHAAFEVVDLDAVGMGQRVLRERGWRHAWGMGRHILGSQIFDYWHDPSGQKHEHYCDGDLFTEHLPMGVHPVSRGAMSQWGQVMPRSFSSPPLTPGVIAAAVHHVRRSPDLSLRKLFTLARLFG